MAELHQMGSSLVGLMDRLGVGQAALEDVPLSEGLPLMSHTEFLERSESHARYAADAGLPECAGTLRVNRAEVGQAVQVAVCDGCGFAIGTKSALMADELQARRRQAARLPARFAGKPFDKTPESVQARDILRAWVDEKDLLPAPALWGKMGRGKSHLIVLAADMLLARGHDVVYWTLADLLDEMQEEIGAESRAWQRALTVEVLVLDDPGGERETDWHRDRFERLVDRRYQDELPILLATNCAPARWEQAYGARVGSRLLGMTLPVELRGRDWRQQTLTEGGGPA